MSRRLAMLAGVILIVGFTIGPASHLQAREDCQDRTGESGFFNKTIDSGGFERHYILYVPPGYEADAATPLVFNFHGLGRSAEYQYTYTEMNRMADRFKFILVTPSGLGSSWNAGDGCCGFAGGMNIDDVGFTSEMIDSVSEEYCIDQHRVYATGFSNGGMMSWRLACELSERILGIGPVAGAILVPCLQVTSPVSVIAFHGDEDMLVPYEGGEASADGWGDGLCSDASEVVYAEGDVTCIARTECQFHTRVVFCTVEGGGHNWPGAAFDRPEHGHTTHDIDASRAIARFFKRSCNDPCANQRDIALKDCNDSTSPRTPERTQCRQAVRDQRNQCRAICRD